MYWKRILAYGLAGVMLTAGIPSAAIAAEAPETGIMETKATRAASQTISGLKVTFYEPETGKKLVNPEILSTASGTHFTTVGDRAASPATLTLNPNSRKATSITFADGIWGYSGEIMAAAGGANNSKFDVSGATPLIIRFKMKSDRVNTGTISGSENRQAVQLLGKMDEQYGVQLMEDAVVIYAHDNAGGWVENSRAIDSSFWGKWHEIMAVFTGTKMQVYVDGQAGSASEGRPNAESGYSVTLKSYSDSVFTTGYNKEKKDTSQENDYMPYAGLLSDIELFSGTDYTSGLTKAYTAVSGALDEATPKFDLTLKPYRAHTKWYKNNAAVAAGTSCTDRGEQQQQDADDYQNIWGYIRSRKGSTEKGTG